MSIKKEESLLLSVDVKDMLNHKTILNNTNSYDSIETKKNQVFNNIINNTWVLYNKIINNKIEEEIDKRFYSFYNIEYNNYDENEQVMLQVISNRKTLTDFSIYVKSKYGNSMYANIEFEKMLNNVTKNYFENQQQTTTKTIRFNGRKPKTFVLKRLEQIAITLDSYSSVIFTNNELKRIISDILDNPDERTAKAYYECMIDYAKQQDGIISGMYEVKFNMRGFSDIVRNAINEKYAIKG